MTRACRRLIQVCFLAGTVFWPCALFAQQPASPNQGPPAPAKTDSAKQAAAKSKVDKAAKPKPDATAAQNEVEAAIAALSQGKNDAAVASLSTALSAGSLPPSQTARALYYRGVAYRRQAKPAQAISDLTNALWIKNGISEEQRVDALQQRSGSYREAGLPEQGDPAPARTVSASKPSAGTSKTPPAPTPFAAVAPPAPSTPASSGSSISGFFGSMFGGSTATETASPAVATAAPAAVAAPQRPARQSLPTGFQGFPDETATFYQGPSRAASLPQAEMPATATVASRQPTSTTEAKSFVPAVKPKIEATMPKALQQKGASAAEPPATPATAPAKTKSTTVAAARGTAAGGQVLAGNFQVLVAAVRTAQEAQGVASKLQAGFARELGGRAPIVDQTIAGSLGTIYRVQVGPFSTARDTEPLCAKLKGQGMDCRVVPQ